MRRSETVRLAAILLPIVVLLPAVVAACGHYGKPVRRSSVERTPQVERVEPADDPGALR